MKIDIIYRACGKETPPFDDIRPSRPSWFDKRLCYKSAWDMTSNDPSTFRMNVIFDNTDGGKWLLDYIGTMRVSDGAIYPSTGTGYDSINDQWDLADKLTGDWIYFCEDDYLHTKDAADVMVQGLSRFNLVSLYDHLDRYTRTDDRTIGKETVKLTRSSHWRTAESTCCTYALSRELWNDIKHICRKHGPNDRSFFYELIENNVRLWTPIPGRATHCMKGYMSPLVNWDEVAAGVRL